MEQIEMEDRLEIKLIEQEHRLLQALLNVLRYRTGPAARRDAAIRAIFWCLTARALRAVTVAGITGVGVLGLFLALQANRLLADQNRRLDVQTHLAEAQRRAQALGQIDEILRIVQNDKRQKIDGIADVVVSGRIAVLTQALKPYYAIDYNRSKRCREAQPLLTAVGRIKAALSLEADCGAPDISARPLSPERAQLLLNLIALEADLEGAAVAGATFANSDFTDMRIWSAKLEGVDLRGSSFRNSSIGDLSFLYATSIDNADFTCSHVDHSLEFAGRSAKDAKFAFVNFGKAAIDETSLRVLAEADLTDVNWEGARLTKFSILTYSWYVSSDGSQPVYRDKTSDKAWTTFAAWFDERAKAPARPKGLDPLVWALKASPRGGREVAFQSDSARRAFEARMLKTCGRSVAADAPREARWPIPPRPPGTAEKAQAESRRPRL